LELLTFLGYLIDNNEPLWERDWLQNIKPCHEQCCWKNYNLEWHEWQKTVCQISCKCCLQTLHNVCLQSNTTLVHYYKTLHISLCQTILWWNFTSLSALICLNTVKIGILHINLPIMGESVALGTSLGAQVNCDKCSPFNHFVDVGAL